MKILILTALFPPLGHSGHDERCRQVAFALAERGHKIQVLTSSHRVPAMGVPGEDAVLRYLSLSLGDVDSKSVPFATLYKNERANATLLYQRIAQYKPDLIYIWNTIGLPNSLCFIAEASGLPVVYDVHTSLAKSNIGEVDPWLYWWTQKRGWQSSLRKALLALTGKKRTYMKWMPPGDLSEIDLERSYVCSESLKQEMLDAGVASASSLEVLYPALKHSLFQVKQFYSHNARFMWAGRLIPGKGANVALEAIKLLVERGVSVQLDMFAVGEPIERRRMRELIDRSGLENHIKMVGIAMGEISAYYEKYDAFLFTSRCNDPMPMTPLEVMLSGLPLIASKDGGLVEMLEEGASALIYEAGSAKALAASIEEFMDLPDAGQAMAEQARNSLQETHNLDQYLDRLEQIFAST